MSSHLGSVLRWRALFAGMHRGNLKTGLSKPDANRLSSVWNAGSRQSERALQQVAYKSEMPNTKYVCRRRRRLTRDSGNDGIGVSVGANVCRDVERCNDANAFWRLPSWLPCRQLSARDNICQPAGTDDDAWIRA